MSSKKRPGCLLKLSINSVILKRYRGYGKEEDSPSFLPIGKMPKRNQ